MASLERPAQRALPGPRTERIPPVTCAKWQLAPGTDVSARVTPHQIAQIGWVGIASIAVLVLLGRPLAVALSTFGPSFGWRERAFIVWMAPGDRRDRDLVDVRIRPKPGRYRRRSAEPDPDHIRGDRRNARIYGLSGGPVARALGVARTGPGGVLLVGSSPVGRAIGRAVRPGG